MPAETPRAPGDTGPLPAPLLPVLRTPQYPLDPARRAPDKRWPPAPGNRPEGTIRPAVCGFPRSTGTPLPERSAPRAVPVSDSSRPADRSTRDEPPRDAPPHLRTIRQKWLDDSKPPPPPCSLLESPAARLSDWRGRRSVPAAEFPSEAAPPPLSCRCSPARQSTP